MSRQAPPCPHCGQPTGPPPSEWPRSLLVTFRGCGCAERMAAEREHSESMQKQAEPHIRALWDQLRSVVESANSLIAANSAELADRRSAFLERLADFLQIYKYLDESAEQVQSVDCVRTFLLMRLAECLAATARSIPHIANSACYATFSALAERCSPDSRMRW